MFIKMFFAFLGLSILACNNTNNGTSNSSNQLNSEKKTDSSVAQLKPKREVSILSIEKKIDSTSAFFEDYNLKCSKWILSKTDATTILQVSKEITGSDFHDYYDVLPCYYMGKVNIDGKIASYEINAGSFSVLTFKDTSIYLGYSNKNSKKYFLVPPGIE